jgi:hypothetical protein
MLFPTFSPLPQNYSFLPLFSKKGRRKNVFLSHKINLEIFPVNKDSIQKLIIDKRFPSSSHGGFRFVGGIISLVW